MSPRLIHGDNLLALRALAAEGVVVDLAYLDPPFLTGRTFLHRDGRPAFDDRWSSRTAYLEALGQRLRAVRELLAPHGSVVVHVDPKTSHYVKVLCDEIFGDDAFASEIIWRYRRWPSPQRNFQRVHDVLLRYRKDPKTAPRWNQLYEPVSAKTKLAFGTHRQLRKWVDGKAVTTRSTQVSLGCSMGDVWELSCLNGVGPERTGYPTQKPERLLERLVSALSDPGDLVLDPYMGSGTTLAVAARLGRRSIGIDASDVAIETAARRLECGVERAA